ncbi:ATP-binding protein [Terricaulis silvestris]|uniref:histidine kinase n=1 Tax=Terricaulis silvestris TaxID=2686094 RepID=A0A6I6MPD4_9CAUL|nr:ATP-binding protein [Terricaulis silvestris]QGZ93422.1 Blue-light-activated protein [Terricaulis silvestris]
MKAGLALIKAWSAPTLSIRHVLLLITAALTLMIAFLAARDLLSNGERLNRAHELRDAIAVSDLLFDATGKISIERDLALSMLQASDAETLESLQEPLSDSRQASDAAIATALDALHRFPGSDLLALQDQLRQRRDEIVAMRPTIDAALSVTASGRDSALASRWEATSTALMTDVENLWLGFVRPFSNDDAVLTQHLRYRHMLRTITDYTGRERSIIGQLLSENVNPSLEQTAELLRGQGMLDQSWRLSRLIADESGLYPAIAAEYNDAESHYATLHDMTREMFYVQGARYRGVYPIGPDLWFELSSQASESLAALRDASRNATRAYLDDMIAKIERTIFLQVLISLLALALCGAGFWLIMARAIRPIDRIVDALTRAVRGEAVDFAGGARRDDEIGKLTTVLDAFQDNLEEVRRTADELDQTARALEEEVVVRRGAEQRTHEQLERLALLHQISRAIGERQDLGSIFKVAVGNVEERLPADFVCVCTYERADNCLKVERHGQASAARAIAMAMTEGALVAIDANGLSRCMSGRLVYESNLTDLPFPFPQRLAEGGLRSLVAAPLQVESQVFGALIVARAQAEAFSSGECEFLRQLSEHVALAAHQAQLNEALQRAYDELRQTQEVATQQERLRALGQMASGIAHDINNALSPIALYTESLLNTEPGLSKVGRGKLEVVQRAIDDAARTIARMNEFYRKRDAALELAPVHTNVLVKQVMDLTQARWRDMPQERGDVVEMRTDLTADIPALLGVESEIREALTNLVFNAIDALPLGGAVTLRTRSTTGPDGSSVDIEVIDNGHGMDEATRSKCLEPFFTTKGERGTGLGLAMVYGMVQRHSAGIEIDSAPGQGTTVRLKFQAATASADQTGAPIARPLKRLRLLIVDDDPILLRSLRDVLAADGHAVTSAAGGAAALEMIDGAGGDARVFDAVITDLGMPGVDGRRVAAAVKQKSETTPVILLTGWGERMRAEEETPPNVDSIVSKPPKLAELRAVLAAHCSANVQTRSA